MTLTALHRVTEVTSDKLPSTTAAEQPARTWANFMPRKLASTYLGEVHGVYIGVQQLAKLAMLGKGPEYCQTSYRVIYPRESLDAYALSRRSPAARSVAEHFVRDEAAARKAGPGNRRKHSRKNEGTQHENGSGSAA